MIYFIADTHFNHNNIIQYCDRPFKSVGEMNAIMIYNWNRKVQPTDIIYMLGDFALGKREIQDFTQLVQSLNGHKILILGNHDHLTKAKYLQAGFEGVYNTFTFDYEEQTFNLTHHPQIAISPNKFYLFGHVHNLTAEIEKYPNTLCVSAERINYTPISIIEVQNFFKNKK